MSGDAEREQRLDIALAQALRAPPLPGDFRTRLDAALRRANAADHDLGAVRSALAHEQRAQLAKLDADYVRLKRRLLGTLIGAAFAAGAASALAMPWLRTNLGPHALLLLIVGGTALGVALAASLWLGRGNPIESL